VICTRTRPPFFHLLVCYYTQPHKHPYIVAASIFQSFLPHDTTMCANLSLPAMPQYYASTRRRTSSSPWTITRTSTSHKMTLMNSTKDDYQKMIYPRSSAHVLQNKPCNILLAKPSNSATTLIHSTSRFRSTTSTLSTLPVHNT
jgi:hypothetical protein